MQFKLNLEQANSAYTEEEIKALTIIYNLEIK